MKIFDDTRCALGEGPLWHPGTGTLYWFDILGKRMFARGPGGARDWEFDEMHSAAGWVDETTLLLASETALWRFDTATDKREKLAALEADNSVTRSNDGRADPWGGFWIGTMGKNEEAGAGSIYRYYQGELRRLVKGITVTNCICFAPDRSCAYYTDTPTCRIMRLPLDAATGWPSGRAKLLIDLSEESLYPDGAVTDAEGTLWVALWGRGQVAAIDADGNFLRRITVPAKQPTCPAFGGPELCDLYLTSAAEGIAPEKREKYPCNGVTFRMPGVAQGVAEPQVRL
jgi:sugar lactone lactonase YvrE